MEKNLVVLNSDAVNKYGMVFTVSALESGMWKTALEGVPMHLGHDMHRPVGWMMPYGLYFQPRLTRAIGVSLIPENDAEQKKISALRTNFIYERTEKEIEEHGEDLVKVIQSKLSTEYKYFDVNGLSILDSGIVYKLFPHLKISEDEDNLIPLKVLLEEFDYKEQGVFVHKKLPICVYAHQYFRKSFSRHNNFHFIFLDELMALAEDPNVSVRIALDLDMVGYSPANHTAFELEFWYGPKFDDDISSIDPGLTRHQCKEFERVYYGISATEFFWKTTETTHEFELEELREDESPTLENTFGCRYIHSIYDDIKKTFNHFDGAIRSYDSELYFERIDKKMTEFGRRSKYKKIFRVDGSLGLAKWKSLCTNYMQGNPLMYEYFNIERPENNLEKADSKPTLKEVLCPYSMQRLDGIRMMVTYHNKNGTHTESHVVSICDLITLEDGQHDSLEYSIVEIKKALQRVGKNLVIPKNVIYTFTRDQYWNAPCIFHGSDNPQEDLDATCDAFRRITGKMVERNANKVISLTLAWNMGDKEVRVSVMGHSYDLNLWLNQIVQIPVEHEVFIKWLEKQKAYMGTLEVLSGYLPTFQKIFQFDGVLYLKRRIVDPKYKISLVENEDSMDAVISIPESEPVLKDAVTKEEILPVIAGIVKEAICSKSQTDYFNSPHSRFLDDDVTVIFKELDVTAFYWSDKPI